jgi:hypothetical protein
MADGGSSDANTANACPPKTAAEGNICDRVVRLMKRCDRHRLRRRGSEQQGKTSNSYQPDHSDPPSRCGLHRYTLTVSGATKGPLSMKLR